MHKIWNFYDVFYFLIDYLLKKALFKPRFFVYEHIIGIHRVEMYHKVAVNKENTYKSN